MSRQCNTYKITTRESSFMTSFLIHLIVPKKTQTRLNIDSSKSNKNKIHKK